MSQFVAALLAFLAVVTQGAAEAMDAKRLCRKEFSEELLRGLLADSSCGCLVSDEVLLSSIARPGIPFNCIL